MINHFLWCDRNWLYRSLTPFKTSWSQFRFCTFVGAGVRYRCVDWGSLNGDKRALPWNVLSCVVWYSFASFSVEFAASRFLKAGAVGASEKPADFYRRIVHDVSEDSIFIMFVLILGGCQKSHAGTSYTDTAYNWETIFLCSLFL
jgi:hypothetical protein